MSDRDWRRIRRSVSRCRNPPPALARSNSCCDTFWCRPICRFRSFRNRGAVYSLAPEYSFANRLEMKMHGRTDALSETAPEATWPEDIFAILQRFDVRQGPYVPDAGHSQLIERLLGASSMRAVPLTTEEEGVALLAGAWAGGQRGVLLMQSSGVGNCVNMLSLTQIFRFPFLTL